MLAGAAQPLAEIVFAELRSAHISLGKMLQELEDSRKNWELQRTAMHQQIERLRADLDAEEHRADDAERRILAGAKQVNDALAAMAVTDDLPFPHQNAWLKNRVRELELALQRMDCPPPDYTDDGGEG